MSSPSSFRYTCLVLPLFLLVLALSLSLLAILLALFLKTPLVSSFGMLSPRLLLRLSPLILPLLPLLLLRGLRVLLLPFGHMVFAGLLLLGLVMLLFPRFLRLPLGVLRQYSPPFTLRMSNFLQNRVLVWVLSWPRAQWFRLCRFGGGGFTVPSVGFVTCWVPFFSAGCESLGGGGVTLTLHRFSSYVDPLGAVLPMCSPGHAHSPLGHS